MKSLHVVVRMIVVLSKFEGGILKRLSSNCGDQKVTIYARLDDDKLSFDRLDTVLLKEKITL